MRNQNTQVPRQTILTLVLLIDESPDSTSAMKILSESGQQFLTVRAPDVSAGKPPVLFVEQKRIEGVDQIKKYVETTKLHSSTDTKLKLTLRALKKLGISVSLDTFDQRLIVQKVVYLLQYFGLPVDWNYSWYLRGPYSTELTKALFETPESSRSSEARGDDSEINRAVTEIRKHFSPAKMSPGDLEAAATVLFIGRSKHAKATPARLVMEVIKSKPNLSKPKVKKYVDMLWLEISSHS